jgi:hypothetical protein
MDGCEDRRSRGDVVRHVDVHAHVGRKAAHPQLLTCCNDAAFAAGAAMIPSAAASEQPSAIRVRRFVGALMGGPRCLQSSGTSALSLLLRPPSCCGMSRPLLEAPRKPWTHVSCTERYPVGQWRSAAGSVNEIDAFPSGSEGGASRALAAERTWDTGGPTASTWLEPQRKLRVRRRSVPASRATRVASA